MVHQIAASRFPMQINYLQQSLAVFLPLHKSSFDFPVFEPLLQPVYWWTWQNPTQNLQKPIDPYYNVHGATFWERLRAGNVSLDSGQLLQGIYSFCRKKILYGLCPKLHFQNACPKLHKRSKLRSYGGTYRKQILCSFTFELKKKNLVPNCTCVMNMGTVYRKITS